MKIGDILWKSAPPYILEYKIIGSRHYEDNTQYELECLTCTHGEKCRVLVGGKPKVVFIQVLNDEEDEHHYWHSDATRFWPTKRQAQLERLLVHIRDAKASVEKCEKTLAGAKGHLQTLLDNKCLIENELTALGVDVDGVTP